MARVMAWGVRTIQHAVFFLLGTQRMGDSAGIARGIIYVTSSTYQHFRLHMPGKKLGINMYSGVYRSRANNGRIDTTTHTSRTKNVHSPFLYSHRMSSIAEGPVIVISCLGEGDDAESRAFRIPPRGPMTDGADSESRAIRIGPTTGGFVALIAAACAWNVVETTGQPFPGPLRFCSVSVAALMRASWDAVELSSGKEIETDGLLRTWPAATFAFRL